MTTFPSGECFIIECRTGCTCCAAENHLRGPYKTDDDALETMLSFQKHGLLKSQYAPKGAYSLHKTSYEELPDGRLILSNKLIAERFLDQCEYGEELARGDYWSVLDAKYILSSN